MNSTNLEHVRTVVKEQYGRLAQVVLKGEQKACCGTSCCGENQGFDPITANLYEAVDTQNLPEQAVLASLGCGNPTALAELKPGESVLDLGSGGGIDVLLSAKRVGPTGFAYGLDMTDEMLALAEKNKAAAGASNVAFLKGHIEEIPLPDASVDVIVSNCVINLSADKPRVLREAFRVLRPGGRFAVSDVVTEGEIPAAVREDMSAYVGCVAGALDRAEYLVLLTEAGFVEASIEPTRRYTLEDMEASVGTSATDGLSPEDRKALDGAIFSGFIRARKPA
ncbi:MAG: arsenite methyltransferase [Fimbriimonadaceae bacterium]|nr:arsenite methyltransferase [Fimbriimonadaceae bacterium]